MSLREELQELGRALEAVKAEMLKTPEARFVRRQIERLLDWLVGR